MKKLFVSVFLLALFIFTNFSNQASAELIGKPIDFSDQYKVGDQFMGIKLLGTLDLSSNSIKGYAVNEISALAWSEDDQILYALSDKGYFLHLRPVIKEQELINIELLDAYPLRNKKGKKLKGDHVDAEGMDIINGNNQIKGDDELVISFELKPRIIRYDNAGNQLEKYELPKPISKVELFDFKNAALESLVMHPQHGILTSPQMALRSEPKNLRTIHDLKGNLWYFEPQTRKHSSITDLEITSDGSVLILERRYSNILSPIMSIIRKIDISKPGKKGEAINTETIASFDSSKGWKLDNFEGLSRHQDNRYFLISDNNQNIFQSTLLVYFEIIEE